MTEHTKSTKLPSFTGLRKDFQMWWLRFLAYGCVWKFERALVIGGESTLPANWRVIIDEATEEGKEAAAAIKRNNVAMANFTMAFGSEGLFGMIYKTKTTDWPSGLAHKVVAQLIKKYNPEDRMSRVELRTQLGKVSMKVTDDPNILFEQVSAIRNRFESANHAIDEDELIAVVMDKAPEVLMNSDPR